MEFGFVPTVAPFVLQGMVMGVDEFYCHRRRELRRWERLGHPVDTLSFIAVLVFALLFSPSVNTLWIFLGLGVFSSLLITKDEWQHRELCSGFENWLHALLFVLHPVVLMWAGYLWWYQFDGVNIILGAGVGMSSLFFLYQTLYWNFWAQ